MIFIRSNRRVIITLFYIFFVFSVIISWKNLFDVFLLNVDVIKMLFPFVLIIILLVSNFKTKTNEILSVGSILIAILFFVFSNYQNEKTIEYSLQAIHTYNCSVASSTIPILNSDLSSYGRFDTNLYTQNLAFIYKKYGITVGENSQQAIYDMQYYNYLSNALNDTTGLNEKDQAKILWLAKVRKQAQDFLVKIYSENCGYRISPPFRP